MMHGREISVQPFNDSSMEETANAQSVSLHISRSLHKIGKDRKNVSDGFD
jgi:hypothetical protein